MGAMADDAVGPGTLRAMADDDFRPAI